ncbi:MAG: hypothetical protein ABR977_11485 [Candidatus Dormibacteria bacterium]
MNALALLKACLAVAVYPGTAYLGAVAVAVAVAGRLPAGLRPAQLDELIAAVGVAAASGLLALPSSPLFGLPSGVSLAVLVTAIAAGIAWATTERWPWHRLVAVAAALAPLLGLASAALTLDLRTIAAASGQVGAARPWAVAAILLAVPAVIRPFDRDTARPGRAALVAAIGMACFSLAGFAALAGRNALAVAGFGALAVVVYAGVIGAARRFLAAAGPVLGVLAVVPAAVALVVALR